VNWMWVLDVHSHYAQAGKDEVALGDSHNTAMGTWEALSAQFRTMSVETIHQPNNVVRKYMGKNFASASKIF